MILSAKQLALGLNADTLIPFYQPIKNNINNEITGCEILARGAHPKYGLLNTSYFIESIEANNPTAVLTRRLMNAVLLNIADICRPAGKTFFVTLNITLSLVMNPLFRHYLLAMNKQLQQAVIRESGRLIARWKAACPAKISE